MDKKKEGKVIYDKRGKIVYENKEYERMKGEKDEDGIRKIDKVID